MLSFKDAHIANPRVQLEHPESQVENVFDLPYSEMVAAHLRSGINIKLKTKLKGLILIVEQLEVSYVDYLPVVNLKTITLIFKSACF